MQGNFTAAVIMLSSLKIIMFTSLVNKSHSTEIEYYFLFRLQTPLQGAVSDGLRQWPLPPV